VNPAELHLNAALSVQLLGATAFFVDSPSHISTVKAADPTKPYDIAGDKKLRKDWTTWISGKGNDFGRSSFGYNYTTLKNYLTPSLGGTRFGGGGGDDEFKRVLRLLVEFLGRT